MPILGTLVCLVLYYTAFWPLHHRTFFVYFTMFSQPNHMISCELVWHKTDIFHIESFFLYVRNIMNKICITWESRVGILHKYESCHVRVAKILQHKTTKPIHETICSLRGNRAYI